MTGDPGPPPAQHPARPAAPQPDEVERRRRRARVFGEVLPETTRDERGHRWQERAGRDDDWFTAEVPPHHG